MSERTVPVWQKPGSEEKFISKDRPGDGAVSAGVAR
jgi:hypothetical protein